MMPTAFWTCMRLRPGPSLPLTLSYLKARHKPRLTTSTTRTACCSLWSSLAFSGVLHLGQHMLISGRLWDAQIRIRVGPRQQRPQGQRHQPAASVQPRPGQPRSTRGTLPWNPRCGLHLTTPGRPAAICLVLNRLSASAQTSMRPGQRLQRETRRGQRLRRVLEPVCLGRQLQQAARVRAMLRSMKEASMHQAMSFASRAARCRHRHPCTPVTHSPRTS